MGNISKRLSEFPGRKSIRGKTGMDQPESGDDSVIIQVGEIVPDLHTRELAFVYNGLVRKGRQVKSNGILFNYTLYQVAGIIPENKKFPFKFFRITDMIGAGNEYLFNVGFNRQSSWSDPVRIYWYLPVSQHFQAQFISSAIENIATFFLEHQISWKEDHAHPIFAISGQMKTQTDAFIKEEFMRGLNHDAGTIPVFFGRTMDRRYFGALNRSLQKSSAP